MKQTETNEFVAQGAATWQEREEHDRIMKALDNVRGFVDSYFYINGNCYYWSTKPLPEEEALAIAQRGRHDEIMYMIHQYGRAKCPGDQQQHLHHVHTCLLPQSVQVIIARRNNREEMDAFLLYNGFEELGQDIVLDREDHEEIMRYVDRHGFKLKQQRRLKQRGNKDEIGRILPGTDWPTSCSTKCLTRLPPEEALTSIISLSRETSSAPLINDGCCRR